MASIKIDDMEISREDILSHVVFEMADPKKAIQVTECHMKHLFFTNMYAIPRYMREQDDNCESFRLIKDILTALSITMEDLERAWESRELDYVFGSISDIIGVSHDDDDEELPKMYMLTNNYYYYGAEQIMNKRALADISLNVGGDFYIIPSSIHELIIVDKPDEVDVDGLLKIVCDVNGEVVSDKDRLSYAVYRYDSANGLVTVAKASET